MQSSTTLNQLRRPRFLQELVLVRGADELIIDGSDQFRILRGRTAIDLLPDLISIMDGTLTVPELEAALPPGHASEHVEAAISLLSDHGLIEHDCPSDVEDARENPETIAFFRRFTKVTGRNRSGVEAYQKLDSTRILIVSSPEASYASDILQALLIKTGIQRVDVIQERSTGILDRCRPTSGALIVSLSIGNEDREWGIALDEWCLNNRVSWLRVQIDENDGHADFGPLFHGSKSPCYNCFWDVHSLAVVPSSQRRIAPRATNRYCIEFGLGLLAAEVVYLLSGIGPVTLGKGLRRFDLPGWDAHDLSVFRVPGCLTCRPLSPTSCWGAPGFVDTAVVFEECIALESRTLIDPAANEASLRLGVQLSRNFKNFIVCKHHMLEHLTPHFPIGTLDALINGPSRTTDIFSIQALTAVLQFTAGIRESPPPPSQIRRWAATGGNLGSVELYVVVRSVDGVSSGIHFYESQGHSLADLTPRHGLTDPSAFIKAVAPMFSKSPPDVLVVCTASLQRVRRKYGAFGLRLIHLDAGVAMSQLSLVAESLGLCFHRATSWRDDLIEEALKLDSKQETITAVVGLSRSSVRSCSVSLDRHDGSRLSLSLADSPKTLDRTCIEAACSQTEAPIRRPPSTKPARYFSGMSTREVAAILQDESRTTEENIHAEEPAFAPINEHHCGQAQIHLPAPFRGGSDLGSVLLRRRTVRRYAETMLTLEHVSTMLYSAYRNDAEQYPLEHLSGDTLDFLVIASRVVGLEAGVYKYEFQKEGLQHWGPTPETLADVLVQKELADAPVQVWVVGNLAAFCAKVGVRGYTQLLRRAGSAAHRMWLAALGMNLDGAIIGGLISGGARHHLGLDGFARVGLVAFAVGFDGSAGTPTESVDGG